LRTATTGALPPLEPLLDLDPFELLDLGLDDFDFELDDFGFAFFADPGFADFDFAAFGLAFDLDCGFGFEFVDELALFDARFFDWVWVMFLSPRGCPY